MTCTAVSHEHVKNTPAWKTLAFVGIHCGELELRNCHCGSTLGKQLPVVRFWTIRRSDEVRVEFTSGFQTVLRPRELDDALDENLFAGTDDSLDAAMDACSEAYDARHPGRAA